MRVRPSRLSHHPTLRSIVLVFTAIVVAGQARAGSLDAVREEASRRLVRDYEELARWCGLSKLPLARDRLYEAILFFEPDHAKARDVLRYTRDATGTWVRDPRHREPGNYNPDAMRTYESRRAEIAGRFTKRLLDLLGQEPSPLARQRAVDAMIAADPENPRIRELNGEERVEDRWQLVESGTARLRRRTLRLAVRAEVAGVAEPKPVRPGEEEEKLGVRWQAAFDGADWRAVGSVAESELRHAVRIADAARPVVEAVFGIDARRRRHSTFYLLRGPADARAMMAAHPAFTDRHREYYKRLAGAWVPGSTDFMQWSGDTRTRLDAVARMACSFHMAGSLSIEKKPGWAVEGVGIYLTHLLTGTRRTLLVRRTGYAERREDPTEKLDLWERTQMPGADWLQLAREMGAAGGMPDLRFVMSKDLNQMTIEDVLCAHALAAYLIEGRPDEAVPFLTALGRGVPMDQAVADHLHTTVEGLAHRLRRWLEETAGRS